MLVTFTYGNRLFGGTDIVPGCFYVATDFQHFCAMPVSPIRSYVVFAQDGDSFRGVPIGLYGRSVLLGYFRAWTLLLGCVMACLGGILISIEGRVLPIDLTCVIVGVVLIVVSIFLMALPRLKYATPARAQRLVKLAGFNDEVRIAVDESMGIITDLEAQAQRAKLDADGNLPRTQPAAPARTPLGTPGDPVPQTDPDLLTTSPASLWAFMLGLITLPSSIACFLIAPVTGIATIVCWYKTSQQVRRGEFHPKSRIYSRIGLVLATLGLLIATTMFASLAYTIVVEVTRKHHP